MRLFRTILAATDLVETPDPVVVSALKTAIHQKAVLIILHVLESRSDSDRSRVRDFRSGEDIFSGADYVQEVLQALRNTYLRFIRPHDTACPRRHSIPGRGTMPTWVVVATECKNFLPEYRRP